MTKFFLAGAAAFLLSFSSFAYAQNALPDAPDPIQNLAAEGAQLRYLGKDHGLDAWIAVKGGQEQYFYVMPDGKAFVMGVLFNDKGELVTVEQVQRLQASGDDMLDSLAEGAQSASTATTERAAPNDTTSASERMFADVAGSNWVALGNQNAPVVYSFIDPQCPHCHEFIKDVRGDIDSGALQVRIIPVGLREDTQAQSAFLLAAPNAAERWFAHLDGDESALPVNSEIDVTGAQRNMAVMQSWKMNVTPMIVYRAGDGSIKIVRGRPGNKDDILGDL